jgi:hypothetical protein
MRGLRVGGRPSSSAKYLFSERGSPYEITLILRKRLSEELANLSPDVLLKSSEEVTNDIVRRYTLNVPVLDRTNISEYEPTAIRLGVPQNSQYGFFAGPGPHFIDATEFKIRIPFTGDRNLFRYATTGYGNPIEGEVADDAVILTHAAVKIPNIEAINRAFNERLGRIETHLQFSRDSVRDWNSGLANIVKPAIEKRFATIQQNKKTTLGSKRVEGVERSAAIPSTSRPVEPREPARLSGPLARRSWTVSPSGIAAQPFCIAFSFPGEARYRIGPVAAILEQELGGQSVFYDEWYKSELARPNLDLLLQEVYTTAELVVVCLCADYERKEWCGLEWRAIRDLIKRRQDKVMFLRLDAGDVAGAFSIDGYLDLRTHNDADVASLIKRRVTGNPHIVTPPTEDLAATDHDSPDQILKPPAREISIMEETRRNRVASLLQTSEPEELRVLAHLAVLGRTDVSAVNRMCSNTVPINNLLLANLVKHIPAPPGVPGSQQFYEINQPLLDAVVFNLNVRGLLSNS